ncbi:hypothetical protein [Flavobacterium frigidarium]|uniref:hypothetical protein n=1 Tax=Flavobacterium frigidarium TaxID=99286 RepID=UPI0030DA081B|tara:strand:- start:223 stop:564 length:342 start_codon:yes stop_codon:yes gene_type:complete
MKYAEFIFDNNKIEFVNSYIGMEKVLINDQVVSRKFSLSGVTHQLNINDLLLKTSYKQFANREIEITLISKGEIVAKQVLPTDIKQRIFWMVIGVASGIASYRFLNYLVEIMN